MIDIVEIGLVHPAVPRRRARGRAEEHQLVRDGHCPHFRPAGSLLEKKRGEGCGS